MTASKDTASDISKTLMVIDGHSMAYRAFFALPAENFQTATGQHTNAVYGFLSMLLAMIREQKPTHVAVAFDLDTPTFRSERYSEYKAGRDKTPEEFSGQIDLIKKVMDALQIPSIEVDGYEADDIVATMSTNAAAAGWDARIVSGDRDTFQLINDNVTVLYPMRGVSELPPFDADTIVERYGVTPAQYPELAALVGESADNLPGVPGVGPGFAARWLKKYGSLKGVLDHIDEIGGKKGDALREHLDAVKRNRELNALVTTLELPLSLEEAVLVSPDRNKVSELFDALEFNTIRDRVFTTFDQHLGGAEESEPDVDMPETALIDNLDDWQAFLVGVNEPISVYFHINPPATITRRKIPAPGDYGEIHALGFSTSDATAVIDIDQASAELGLTVAAFLADERYTKVVYDLKTALKALATAPSHSVLPAQRDVNTSIIGVADDVLLSAYILQPDRRGYELADLVQTYLNARLNTVPTSQNQGQLVLEGVNDDNAAQLAQYARNAWMIHQLNDIMGSTLEERGSVELLHDLEIPLSVVLAKIELIGIAIDRQRLDNLLAGFTSEVDKAQESAYASIGGDQVNLASPKQLQIVLFETLDMPKTRKTKTGFSTDADSLADLLEKTDHPFLHNLMAYRDATKLRQTVQGLLDSIADDERVHTRFSQTAAATGRLSSLNPNLQNIPVRTPAGRQIRDIFVAGTNPCVDEPTTLLTADYSQIEMRIMAHMSEDDGLIQAYKDGEDLHRFVGSQVFDVEPDEVTTSMRDKVKAMSYGLAYGLSSFGLSRQLRISVDEARELMSSYFDRFGAVQRYLRNVVRQARKDGYTQTMLGRRRYLPDLQSDNRQLREMAERAALNAPIQGSAADLIKKAMLGVQERLEADGLKSRMILQVHDELILEVIDTEIETAEQILVEEMSAAANLLVPLDVQVGKGYSWHEAAH
ncbi:DNA polymerase I [Yaniella flava]|uniref:DNA polymerase I n=2 Tax=Yaniella flava TaxID=287930 RepID=A0ABP5G9L1_9MICC